MSDGMGREFTYLSSHATNRYFIPNWGTYIISFIDCGGGRRPPLRIINCYQVLDFLFLLFASSPERNPIGRRTESDRPADGIRSGGGRNPIGRRTESDRAADATRCLFVNKKDTKNPSMRDVLGLKRPSLREIFSRFVPLRGIFH